VRRMHQAPGGRHQRRSGGEGKQRRLVAPFNPISTQARSRELIILVRVTTKS